MKVVQLVYTNATAFAPDTLLALCDDGTIWLKDQGIMSVDTTWSPVALPCAKPAPPVEDGVCARCERKVADDGSCLCQPAGRR